MPGSIQDAFYSFLLLVLVAAGSLVLSTPLVLVAIWRYYKTRTKLHTRALLLGMVNGLGQGLTLTVLGFVLAAAIGDESAGKAALFLAFTGLVVGGGVATVLSYLFALMGCKLVGCIAAPREE